MEFRLNALVEIDSAADEEERLRYYLNMGYASSIDIDKAQSIYNWWE